MPDLLEVLEALCSSFKKFHIQVELVFDSVVEHYEMFHKQAHLISVLLVVSVSSLNLFTALLVSDLGAVF